MRKAMFTMVLAGLLLVGGAVAETVHFGTVSDLSDPNVVDMSGNVVYAIDIGGDGGSLDGVTFDPDDAANNPKTAANNDLNVGSAESVYTTGFYPNLNGPGGWGTSFSSNPDLNDIMSFGRNDSGERRCLQFNVISDHEYVIQILYKSAGTEQREWDLSVGFGTPADKVDNTAFAAWALANFAGDNLNEASPKVWTTMLTATSDWLWINAGKAHYLGDTTTVDPNPILNAIVITDTAVITDPLPVVNAGPNDSVELTGATADYVLQGSASDPESQPLTIGWTATGPSTVSFDDPASPTAVATFDTPGDYTLKLTADDGVNDPVFDNVLITVALPPVVNVMNGAVAIVTNNIDYVVDPNSDPNNVVALNCGQGYFTGAVPSDAWATGIWGDNVSINAELLVNGITFIADMANTNYDSTRAVAFAAKGPICGANGGNWWWNAGTDDGLNPVLSGVDAHVTGNDSCGSQAVSPYEGDHNHAGILLTGTDPASVQNFGRILSKAGVQNTGNYNAGAGMADRDDTYDFNVMPGWLYNVKVIPYKNNGEQSHTRVLVDGVLVLDDFQVLDDIDNKSEFAVISKDVITSLDQSVLRVVVGTATTPWPGEGGQNVQDVSAIIVQAIEEVDNMPPIPDAGPDAPAWFVDGTAALQLQGSAEDPDQDSLGYLWTATGPGTVTFIDDEDPLTTANFSDSGVYTLTLTVSDPYYNVPDDVVITVYDDGCAAAKGQGIPQDDGDINKDCVTDIVDLAILAGDWLQSTSL